ncbi:MAG: DUF2490 domain-containing protein [Bacteroidales bacterium]|nr:DUF2490 domain-containing protein [Bacteroidales bacterium]
MKRHLLIVIFALIALSSVAQETNFSLRPAVKVEKSITEKFSLQLGHQTRYYTNLSEFERFSASLEGKYAISKNWDAGLAYVWLYKHAIDDDLYARRNRYYLYLKYKVDVANWNFSINEMFKSTFYNKTLENPSYTPKNVLLTKLEVAYKIKPISLTPYINGQLRCMVNHPDKNELNQYRWTLGAKYKINQLLGVGLYFEQRVDMNSDSPDKVNIIGAELKISI